MSTQSTSSQDSNRPDDKPSLGDRIGEYLIEKALVIVPIGGTTYILCDWLDNHGWEGVEEVLTRAFSWGVSLALVTLALTGLMFILYSIVVPRDPQQ